MLINWFTVFAQILNFLILVVLLKYLLYDRIVRAMDKREENIRLRLEEAQKQTKEAEGEAETFRTRNRELDEKREAMILQAKEDADEFRKRSIGEIRQEIDNLRSAWLDSLQREKAAFIQVLRTMTTAQVYAIVRKALGDIAHADLETNAIEVFLSRIRELPEPERKSLAGSIEETGNKVTVRSFFEIAPELRQKVTESVHRHIAAGIAVNFETAPDLIMGIELKTRGHKISWSLQDYLAELEEKTLLALEKEDRQKPRSQTEIEISKEGPKNKLRITKESDNTDES